MKNKDIKDSRTEKAEEKTAAQEKPAEGELDRETMGDEKYIEALEHKVGELMAENASSRAVTLRLQADFDNYRKRNAALAEEMKALGKSMVIERLLGVLDNCALARKYITDEAQSVSFEAPPEEDEPEEPNEDIPETGESVQPIAALGAGGAALSAMAAVLAARRRRR